MTSAPRPETWRRRHPCRKSGTELRQLQRIAGPLPQEEAPFRKTGASTRHCRNEGIGDMKQPTPPACLDRDQTDEAAAMLDQLHGQHLDRAIVDRSHHIAKDKPGSPNQKEGHQAASCPIPPHLHIVLHALTQESWAAKTAGSGQTDGGCRARFSPKIGLRRKLSLQRPDRDRRARGPGPSASHHRAPRPRPDPRPAPATRPSPRDVPPRSAQAHPSPCGHDPIR